MAVGFACGSKNGDSGFNDGTGSDGGQIGEGGKGFGGGIGEGGTGGCTGLQCKEVDCPGGGDTTITGQVFDPIGLNPLYGVAVYVPSQLPLSALSTGATCDRCGATVLNPASTTLTDEQGKFTLTHVPVDAKVPVVVQIGKWRRTFNLDVTACQENPMPTPLTLPKNGTEGDMPQMAVAVNGYDALECLIYGMGVDESEFSSGGTGSGHVHLYSSAQ
ncbi:MAG: carboxypeptidase regulatory-like domain-containing protein, partial [Polyangiaceae bacterium]